MKLTVKEYSEGDYEKYIYPLEKENMKEYLDKHIRGGWSKEKSKKGFQKNLEKGWIFLFEIKNKIIGYATLTPDKVDKSSLFINQINIKKEFQRKGYGSEILHFIEEKSKELGFKKIRLCVFEDNPSFGLYQRFGYQQIGFTKKMHLRFMEKVIGQSI